MFASRVKVKLQQSIVMAINDYTVIRVTISLNGMAIVVKGEKAVLGRPPENVLGLL